MTSSPGVLEAGRHTTEHRDLGPTAWYTVRAGEQSKPRAAWQHTGLPDHASVLKGRVAFAWRAMDAFYEEDERIVGHAADAYHRIDIRQTSRHLVVRHGDRVIADTHRPLALYESGFAPRWYVPRDDVDDAALTPVEGRRSARTRGCASYYDIGGTRAARPGPIEDAYPEVRRIAGWSLLSRTRSRWTWTAPGFGWSPARTWSRTASTATSPWMRPRPRTS